ncbi:MAG: hypothetical protein IJW15_01965 [Clostridia bacterium]|nr:hypothetical protein [Clostridia bacterium]
MSFDFQKYIDSLEEKAGKNDIGKMIASGIGVGLSQNSYLAVTALENVYVELETVTKNAAKNAEKLEKKRQERELSNLKNSLKLELISEQEYYEKLKKYRDENLREGTDSWYKYTEEIISYNKRLMDEATKQQLEMVEEIHSLQKELEENLKADDGPWFSSLKVLLKNVNSDGSSQGFVWNNLKDFEKEIDLLQRYRNAILALKNLGDIPDGVFSDIANMDVSEAISAAGVILSASEETRKKFVEGYTKRNSLAESIAAELNGILNKEALSEAGIFSVEGFDGGYLKVDGQGENVFIKTLEENFDVVPESYYQLGLDSGEAFGNGLKTEISSVMVEIRSSMLLQMEEIVLDMQKMMGEISGISTNSTTYKTTYNFNASRDTTTQQLTAARNAAALERLRGGID